jgi:predicted ABC-type ATPase
LETTLRSAITFEQAQMANENGSRVSMFYVALDTVERHIERVTRRAARGGHSASESTLRRIHARSLNNLPTALIPEKSGIEIVQIYDNSRFENPPDLALEAHHGQIVRIADRFPEWLRQALGWTPQDLERQRWKLEG